MGRNYNENYNNGAVDVEDSKKKEESDFSHDLAYSLTLLILGTFLVLPFFFNIVYIRSTNKHARRMAFGSIILGSMYFIALFITLCMFIFTAPYNYNNY